MRAINEKFIDKEFLCLKKGKKSIKYKISWHDYILKINKFFMMKGGSNGKGKRKSYVG